MKVVLAKKLFSFLFVGTTLKMVDKKNRVLQLLGAANAGISPRVCAMLVIDIYIYTHSIYIYVYIII